MITFYIEFMENFYIPRNKLLREQLPEIKLKCLKKMVRDHSRMSEFKAYLNINYCYVCGKTLAFRCEVENFEITYDKSKS